MPFTRIVADTNVILSALFFPSSTPALAFDRARTEATLLVSAEAIVEIESVILRPKFNRYLALAARLLLLDQYVRCAMLISVTHAIRACRDPRDDKFLELALSGRADLILTGDADLLAMNPWRGIAILTPAEYLSRH